VNRQRFAPAVIITLLFATMLSAESRCSLPHYPVAVGDVNEYRTTSKQLDADGNAVTTESNVYKEEVTSVDPDQYKVVTTTAGNTVDVDWSCTDEGLSVKLGEVPGVVMKSTGVSIPAKLDVGDEWTQTFESGAEGFSQKMVTVNRVTGREQVTVPAGTYEALRVDFDIDMNIPGQGPVTSTGTQWFVPGVGLVKSTSSLPMEAGEVVRVEASTELIKRTTK